MLNGYVVRFGNDSLVVIGIVALRAVAFVYQGSVRSEILCICFARQHISAVALISQNLNNAA